LCATVRAMHARTSKEHEYQLQRPMVLQYFRTGLQRPLVLSNLKLQRPLGNFTSRNYLY
jgi:hypothetical protein